MSSSTESPSVPALTPPVMLGLQQKVGSDKVAYSSAVPQRCLRENLGKWNIPGSEMRLPVYSPNGSMTWEWLTHPFSVSVSWKEGNGNKILNTVHGHSGCFISKWLCLSSRHFAAVSMWLLNPKGQRLVIIHLCWDFFLNAMSFVLLLKHLSSLLEKKAYGWAFDLAVTRHWCTVHSPHWNTLGSISALATWSSSLLTWILGGHRMTPAAHIGGWDWAPDSQLRPSLT